ncbi:MAG: hypothetical protein JNL57_07580 [Bacteroidetes bacterium]|nr:hypothetical protein [Bacteroidota bacterium]
MEEQEKGSFNIFQLWEKNKPLLRRVFSWWKIALIIGCIFGVLGYYLENKKLPTFAASITFMMEDEIIGNSGPANQSNPLLAALTGQTTTSNKAVILDLGKSNLLIENTLLQPVQIDGKTITLGDYYFDINGYRNNWKNDKKMSAFKLDPKYKIGTDELTDFWLRQVSNILKLSLTSSMSDAGVFSINFKYHDERFTKLFLDNHLKTISEFYITKKTERAMKMAEFARRKRDSLLMILQGKEYGLAARQNQAFGTVQKTAVVPELQFKRDITILTAQYNESVGAMNSAKLDYERQKPFLSIIDDVRYPLNSSYPKPMMKGILFLLVGIILGFAGRTGWILGKEFLQKQRDAFKQESIS